MLARHLEFQEKSLNPEIATHLDQLSPIILLA